ncbi:acetyltransferase [Penicillium pulvis]|uniref:acetyltransferase n=1 Tax=Penicillium pulvis TaxID=1562058 RepID=UPI002548B6F7|nr:acetyltransferase [Penicillium pulvis]KAJ5803023.1 acetyltransferase [Penicillium pulvis]
MGFTLRRTNGNDLTELLQIHSAAFKTDQFLNFMLHGKPEGTRESLMERSIKAWLDDPTSSMVTAVRDDGVIVGWACWLRKENEKPESATSINMADTNAKEAPTSMKGAENSAPYARSITKSVPSPASQDDAPDTPTRVVGRQMRSDSMKWEAHFMQGARYLILQALAVSPNDQCQGIGSQLVKWGVERADEERIACWCHASPAGNQLYLKSGFQELGSDKYDLGEFGKYVFRYMVYGEQ